MMDGEEGKPKEEQQLAQVQRAHEQQAAGRPKVTVSLSQKQKRRTFRERFAERVKELDEAKQEKARKHKDAVQRRVEDLGISRELAEYLVNLETKVELLEQDFEEHRHAGDASTVTFYEHRPSKR